MRFLSEKGEGNLHFPHEGRPSLCLRCGRQNSTNVSGGLPQLDNRQMFSVFEIRDMKFKLHVLVFSDIERGNWWGKGNRA